MASGPLSGRRIVVTRSQTQAATLTALLRAEGAEVIEFPTIRIGPPPDYAPCDRAIDRIGEYRWIVFTSQNGVTAFLERLRVRGRGGDRADACDKAAPGDIGRIRAEYLDEISRRGGTRKGQDVRLARLESPPRLMVLCMLNLDSIHGDHVHNSPLGAQAGGQDVPGLECPRH